MTRIADLLTVGPTLSVECFPPKTEVGMARLHETLDAFEPIELSFVSVTYGAGGSTRDATRDIVVSIEQERRYPAMPHLTCMGHTRADIETLTDDYLSHGIENLLALAGDPPADGSAVTGDFEYASQLVELLRERSPDLSIGVAAFPEVHPRSIDRATDREHLAAKLDAADFGITQFFFDADDYFTMIDELAALGCDTPVLPGVIPLLDTTSVRRFATMNGAKFPEALGERIDAAGSEQEALDVAVDAAVTLCHRLVEGGVPGLHFYCLNRQEATLAIVDALGLR